MPYRIDVERITVWEYGVVGTRTDYRAGESGGWSTVPAPRSRQRPDAV